MSKMEKLIERSLEEFDTFGEYVKQKKNFVKLLHQTQLVAMDWLISAEDDGHPSLRNIVEIVKSIELLKKQVYKVK